MPINLDGIQKPTGLNFSGITKLSDLPAKPTTTSPLGDGTGGIASGIAKGEIETVKGLSNFGDWFARQTVGRVTNAIEGKGFTAPAPSNSLQNLVGGEANMKSLTVPTGAGENIGYGIEKAAELVTPGGAIGKLATKTETALKGIQYGSKLLEKVLPFLGKQAVKATGMGVTGGIQSDSAATGGVVAGLEALSPVGASIAKSLFPKIAGFMSSTGTQVLERAMKFPKAIEDAVNTYAKNPEQKIELVQKAKDAITSFNQAKSDAYGKGLEALKPKNSFNGISPATDAFTKKIKSFGGYFDSKGELAFKNTTLTPQDQLDLKQVWKTMDEWTDHSVKGVDNLRQAIGNQLNEFKLRGGNPRSSVVLGDTISALINSTDKNVPGYKSLLKDYGLKSEQAKNLVSELSAGGNAKPSTQLKAVMNLFNKDASVMKNLESIMGKKDAEDFLNEISGAMLSEWLPANKIGTAIRASGEAAAGAGAIAAGAGSVPTGAAGLAGIASMSPRIVGKVATTVGKIAPVLPTVRRAVTGGIISQ